MLDFAVLKQVHFDPRAQFSRSSNGLAAWGHALSIV